MRRRLIPVLAFVAICSMSAFAQLSEDFETGAPAWTLDPAVGGCSWGADATPATTFGAYQCSAAPPFVFASDPTVISGLAALNWNNGTSMDYGLGTSLPFDNRAISPVISVTSTAGLTLTFTCMYEAEGCTMGLGPFPSNIYRIVDILPAASTVPIASFVCAVDDSFGLPPGGGSVCGNGVLDNTGNMSSSHIHTIDLSALPLTDFRVAFRFRGEAYTGVGFEDSMCGWFVDDVQVICPDAINPTIPVLTAPLDGACTPIPALLDWAPSTDVTSCSAGAIASYDVEVALDAAFTMITATGTFSVPGVFYFDVPGTYFWHVSANDASGNPSGFSAPLSFSMEVPVVPSPPDTLFVNEDFDTAQGGDPGFVSPVTDLTPVFSAIYRDANCSGTALTYHLQVSTDPAFLTIDVDTGTLPFVTPVPLDSRCEDLTIGIDLQKDTVYFWRVQFADALGMGAFSASQSFRIGNDFEFGVREGSSHHGRRCWVATAAWQNEASPTVARLQSWRFSTLECSGAGSVASHAYHCIGAVAADRLQPSSTTRLATALIPIQAPLALLFGLGILMAGLLRLRRID